MFAADNDAVAENRNAISMFEKMDVKPMLATDSKPFDAEGYLYEIKWDGIRCIAYLDESITRLKSRSNRDITHEYPEFAHMHEWVTDKPAILDGEIVVLEDGRPSFHRWQTRGRIPARRSYGDKPVENVFYKYAEPVKGPPTEQSMADIGFVGNDVIYVVFDILFLKGRNLMPLPIETRKGMLMEQVAERPEFTVSRIYEGSGTELLKAAAEKGLEGIMAKKAGSPYVPAKRSSNWLKFKNLAAEDLVICGNLRCVSAEVGSVVLGAYDKDRILIFQGIVGSGLTEPDKAYLKEYAARNPAECPFDTKTACRMKELKKTTWMKPSLVCTVQFLERSGGGLRHPSFRGFRFDKDAVECTVSEVHG